MTTTVFTIKTNEAEDKIPDTSSLVTTTVCYKKIVKLRIKFLIMLNILLNKLIAEDFTARLKQADLVKKTDFDNKLIGFNRKITPDKPKYLEVQKKLDSLITKDCNLF